MNTGRDVCAARGVMSQAFSRVGSLPSPVTVRDLPILVYNLN